MDYKTYRGKILYIHDEIGERGREWFTLTRHRNGDRTVRVMCELYDIDLLRDVVYTVDKDWRPVDAFIRLTLKDEFCGSGWVSFTDRYAECETFLANGGRISQRIELDRRPPTFGCHPVICDIWHVGAFDRKSNKKVQNLKGTLMSSPLHTGASGPMLGSVIMTYEGKNLDEFDIEYVSSEKVTVPAGTFDTDHFRYLLGGFPPYDMWCHGDDLIPVKLRFGLNKTTYQLVEFNG
jgi:hypothetical protein